MIGELCKNPGRFAGKRILYIHTGKQFVYGAATCPFDSLSVYHTHTHSIYSKGGLFGLYDRRIDPLLKATPSSNQVYDHKSLLSKNV